MHGFLNSVETACDLCFVFNKLAAEPVIDGTRQSQISCNKVVPRFV